VEQSHQEFLNMACYLPLYLLKKRKEKKSTTGKLYENLMVFDRLSNDNEI
jgi:hypothetical protein